jgi:mercuric reductase
MIPKIRNIFSDKPKKQQRNGGSVQEIILNISGMTCNHCVSGIKKKVSSINGVLDQDVSYKDGQGTFKYDPGKVTKGQIIEAVNSMESYKVTGEVEDSPEDKKLEKLELEIKGMTCNHCATSIEKNFENRNGIYSKEVSYKDGKGTFTFDPGMITKEEIIQAVSKDNYEARPTVNENKENAEKNQYDLIIIGGGSAAFSASTTAAEMGLSVLMVNAGIDLGGTCVNVGCVPSKNLIRNAEQIYKAKHSPFRGVSSANPKVDYKAIIRQKKELVVTLQQKKYLDVVNKLDTVEVLEGWARFVDANTIEVDGKFYKGIKFLLGTGATTNIPEIDGLKKIGYLTNESLFDLEEQPKHLIVLGAGYIALEIAQAYSRFGTRVTILHRSERILRAQESDITDELTMHLQNEGIVIHTNVLIERFEKDGETIRAITNEGIFEASHVLVATGARANTFNMNIQKTGVSVLPSGHIKVNENQETNISHIYAAGDCTNTPAFVYTAAKEGKVAILNAFKSAGIKVDYTALPWVVFTDPQVAGAGLDGQEAEQAGIPYETSIIPLSEVPRAQAALDSRGFIKLIRNTENDKLIGGRIIAPEGGELAMQLSLAIKAGMTIEELADAFHPYLTLSEGIKLAAITFKKDVSELSCCAS